MISSPQNSPSSNGSSTIRKSYHIRSESSVLKSNRRILTRNRSKSTADNPNLHSIQQKKVTFKKRVNRRFESIAIPFPIDDEQEEKGAIPYIRYKSKPIIIDNNKRNHHNTALSIPVLRESNDDNQNNKNTNNNSNNDQSQEHLLTNILHEFRSILVPLQTEVQSLRKITQKLEKQVNILQSENALQRKQSYYTNQSSPNALYIDYLAEINKPKTMTLSLDDGDFKSNKSNKSNHENEIGIATLNNNVTTNTHSLSVNPVYLFNTNSENSLNKETMNRTKTSTRRRARTVSNATIGTIGTIQDNNKYQQENDKTINEIDRMISQSIFSMKREMDEEDDLEIDGHKAIASKITNITNFNFEHDINDDIDHEINQLHEINIDDIDNKADEDGDCNDDDQVSQIYLDGNLDLLSDVDNNIMPTTPISTPPSTPRTEKKSIDETYYEKDEESNEPSHISSNQNASSPSPLILVPNHQIGIGYNGYQTSPITINTEPITIHKKRSNSHHLRHDDILRTAGILKISTSLPQYTPYKSYSHNNVNNNDNDNDNNYHRSNNNHNNYKRNSFVSFV